MHLDANLIRHPAGISVVFQAHEQHLQNSATSSVDPFVKSPAQLDSVSTTTDGPPDMDYLDELYIDDELAELYVPISAL